MKNRRNGVRISGYKSGYGRKKEGKAVRVPVCPYCGRVSVLRPAEYVYGENTIVEGSFLYVCSGYPACGAYVGGGMRGRKSLRGRWRIRSFGIRGFVPIGRLIGS